MIHTRSRYFYETAVRALALFAAVAVCAERAGAFDLRGTVINGTTGNRVGSIGVSVVDPRHGMVTEEEIQTDSRGAFVVENLDEKTSVYLVQVSYDGVTYTELVQPGEDSVRVDVKVYETTTGWDDVRVSLPHLMARRSNDTLSVDRIFLVSNDTDPPKTIHGQGAGFRLFLPEERLQVTSLFVTSLGIPISMEPHPTSTPGIYTIDYPFKPGATQVGVSFDVAYPESGYAYTETLSYALDEVVVMTEDPGMEVTSPSLALGKPEEVRGFKAYRLASLAASSTLALRFQGGGARARPETTAHRIVLLDEPWQHASVALIAGFALLLVLVMAFAARSSPAEVDQAALLTSRKNSILSQIAKLDDLFEMGTVSDQLYREKRGELVETLTRTIHRIDRLHPKKPKDAPRKKGAPHAR